MKILPPNYLAAVVLSFASPVMAQSLTANAVDAPPAAIDLPVPSNISSEILGFERRRFTVQREHGRVLIDGVEAPSDVVERGTKEVRLIEYFDGVHFDSSRDFRNLAKKLRGTRTYTYDVVFLRDANLNEQTIPLVLLPKEQRLNAEVDWRQWLAQERDATEQARVAQQKVELEQQKYVALEKAAAQQKAVASQPVVSLDSLFSTRWRVYLAPANEGLYGFASGVQSVNYVTGIQVGTGSVLYQPSSTTSYEVVAANSQIASNLAHAKYPNYRIVGISKVHSQLY